MSPARIAIIGMGGYAVRHHQTVQKLEETGACRLLATCDPAPARFEAAMQTWAFGDRGVRVYEDYREMLSLHAEELDAVIIPTPIPLHAEMHRAAVEAGLAVYLEKPPTLDPGELEQMIAVDSSARVPTLVGFNFILEPVRQSLKRRLLGGEFGRLESVRLLGLWGRSESYFGRSDWAGKLTGPDGRLILDSCLGNALSHHVHNLLHWAGNAEVDAWASPTSVRCELLRAHSIEGPDTVFLAAETTTGIPVRMALSHACHGPEVHCETLVCQKAEIDYVTKGQAVVRWRSGEEEVIPLPVFDPQKENLTDLLGCWRGLRVKPSTTLRDSRPFVHLHALAYVSAGGISPWPEDEILGEAEGVTAGYLQIKNLSRQVEDFLATGRWPRGVPTEATPGNLEKLESVVRRMARQETPALCA